MINTTKVYDLNQTTVYQIISKFSQDSEFQKNTYNKFREYNFQELEEDVLLSAKDYFEQDKFSEEDMEEVKNLLASLREN